MIAQLNSIISRVEVAASGSEALAFVQKGLDKCFGVGSLKSKLYKGEVDDDPEIEVYGNVPGGPLKFSIYLIEGDAVLDIFKSPQRPELDFGHTEVFPDAIKKNQSSKKVTEFSREELASIKTFKAKLAEYESFVENVMSFSTYLADGTRTK